MAGPFYLSSGNGDNSDGLSKATAWNTWATAITNLAAGETLRVDDAHTESFATAITFAFPGADTTPNIIISIDWTTDAYTRATTAQIDTSTAGDDVNFTGSALHYGMWYSAWDEIDLDTADMIHYFEDCTIEALSTAASFRMGHANGGNFVELVDTIVIGVSGSDGIAFNNVADLIWRNGPNNRSKYTNPGTSPSALFGTAGQRAHVDVSGVDLADLTTILFDPAGDGAYIGTVRNCLLNSGVALSGTFSGPNNQVFSMVGCDDTTGNDLYRTERADYYGTTVTDDANFITTGGASDGTNPIAWKMVSNANALEFHKPTRSYWISGWFDSTGSKTFLIETNSENVTFQDDELWMELEFLDNSADPQFGADHDRMTNVDSTPADQTDSSANPTWTTPGITTEKKQQLNVTKTVNRIGPFRARVCLAKPSATVWIDPFVTIS